MNHVFIIKRIKVLRFLVLGFLSIFLLIFFWFSNAFAYDFDHKLDLEFSYLSFKDDDQNNTVDDFAGLLTRYQSSLEWGGQSLNLSAFLRLDSADSNRNYFRFEDLYYQTYFDQSKFLSSKGFNLSIGYKIYNWSVMDIFPSLDSINSRNFDSDLEQFEKFGELSLEVGFNILAGELKLFYFPKYENPRYPSAKSRLGFQQKIHGVQWVRDSNDFTGASSEDDNYGHQFALKIDQVIGNSDFSFHALYHMDRINPLIGISDFTFFGNTPIPLSFTVNAFHFLVLQIGGNFQYAFDNGLIFKIEGARFDYKSTLDVLTNIGVTRPKDHSLVASGLEYTTNLFTGSSTFLIEYQRFYGLSFKERSLINAFQNDLSIAWRHSLDDTMGTEFFLLYAFDLERSRESFVNFSISRRLSNSWLARLSLRYFDATVKDNFPRGLEILDQDHHIATTLIKYF